MGMPLDEARFALPDRMPVVYGIRSYETGLWKIGRTINPKQRIKDHIRDIGKRIGGKLVLEMILWDGNYPLFHEKTTEKNLHRLYRGYLVTGESEIFDIPRQDEPSVGRSVDDWPTHSIPTFDTPQHASFPDDPGTGVWQSMAEVTAFAQSLGWGLNDITDAVKRFVIVQTGQLEGSKSATARRLLIPRQSLQKTIRRLDISDTEMGVDEP